MILINFCIDTFSSCLSVRFYISNYSGLQLFYHTNYYNTFRDAHIYIAIAIAIYTNLLYIDDQLKCVRATDQYSLWALCKQVVYRWDMRTGGSLNPDNCVEKFPLFTTNGFRPRTFQIDEDRGYVIVGGVEGSHGPSTLEYPAGDSLQVFYMPSMCTIQEGTLSSITSCSYTLKTRTIAVFILH
jgi:hypothetical protein